MLRCIFAIEWNAVSETPRQLEGATYYVRCLLEEYVRRSGAEVVET